MGILIFTFFELARVAIQAIFFTAMAYAALYFLAAIWDEMSRIIRKRRKRNVIFGRRKTMDLCGECAALMKDGYEVKQLPKPTNNKVTCGHCGRRRYGGSYELTKKKVTQ